MNHFIRNTEYDDFQTVGSKLNASARSAYAACGITDPIKLIEATYLHSRTGHTILLDDAPIAIFGAIPLDNGGASLWLSAVELSAPLPVSLIKRARRYIATYLQAYSHVRTVVWHGSKDHVRWVEWLGFKHTGVVPYGPQGELFHTFILGKHNGN